MQSLRRTAVSTAGKCRTNLPRQPRRFAHDEHGHGHGHGHDHGVEEPLGAFFWIAAGAIPASGLLYYVSRPGDPNSPPFLTRMIDKYTENQDELAKKNDSYTKMVERAAADRMLFLHSKPSEHVPLKFPEIMNVGSPYNVPAGSQVNMDKVIEKFRKEAYEDNERKLEALRNGTIKSEQPFKREYQ